MVIKRAIERYIRLVLQDANLLETSRVLPVYTVYTQKKRESTVGALGKVNRRMIRLADQYSRSFVGDDSSEFPILIYGFFLCGPILAVLTMTIDDDQKKINTGKLLSQFDLGERGQDVWNSLAIAITAMYIRSTLINVKEAAVVKGVWRFPDHVKSDVDEDL